MEILASVSLRIRRVSFKSLPYDPTRDYDAVAIVADLAPIMLSVLEKTFPEKMKSDAWQARLKGF